MQAKYVLAIILIRQIETKKLDTHFPLFYFFTNIYIYLY